VHRFQGHGFEHEQVERALEEIGWLRGHLLDNPEERGHRMSIILCVFAAPALLQSLAQEREHGRILLATHLFFDCDLRFQG
jgi:hypothetical protein